MTGKNLILAEDKEKLVSVGSQIRTLLPGADKLTPSQAVSVGNYALLRKADPFRGEVYGYVDFRGNLNLVDGYKLLVRWAKKICEYDEKYSDRLPIGVEGLEEGDIGYRITILRYDKKPAMREFIDLGATFIEAYELVSNDAIGIVLKKETWSKNKNKPIDPPTGWSWDQVARKRALKNVLNQAYAMPSLDELAKDSWIVDGVETIGDDWPSPDVYKTERETETHAKLAAQERQRQEKINNMNDEERKDYQISTEKATDAMRDNGDDDTTREEGEVELSPGMQASAKFWQYANDIKIDRDTAGDFIRAVDGDFDRALKLLKESQGITY